MIVNVTTKQSHYNAYTIIILLFRRPYVVGPMARPEASNMKLFCGPGLDIIVAGWAGPGPHKSICRPGPGRVCTTGAGRAGPGSQIIFAGRASISGPCRALWCTIVPDRSPVGMHPPCPVFFKS